MENVVNRNIDLFIDVKYDSNDELIISTLISENNHINNIGNFTKDTKTNVERFLNLYSNLSNPLIVSFDLKNTISLLFYAFRKHKLTNNKLFHDFQHKKGFFIDASDNIFLNNNIDQEVRFDRPELYLANLFLNYIYFHYNIEESTSDGFDNDNNSTYISINPEYTKKIDYLKHNTIADFKDKPYYEQLFELIEEHDA